MVREYSYAKDKNKALSAHLKVSEFRSYNDSSRTLTTDKILIDDNLITMLEKLYTYLDNKIGLKSIIITSGYRNSDFEKQLSGNTTGYHVQGKAADIMCYKKNGTIISGKEVCLAAEDIGFKGIGYNNNSTHVDVRSTKSYFDETNGKTGIASWYTYFNVSKVNPSTNLKHKVGDTITYNKIYTSSTSTKALNPKVTSGKITKIYPNTRNPYLINQNTGFTNDSHIITTNQTIQKTVANTTYLNLRSTPSYGNNIKYTVKQGTKLTYLGLENGWAKVNYNNQTLYCGPSYLK